MSKNTDKQGDQTQQKTHIETRGQTLTVRQALVADCEALTDLCFRSKQSNGYDLAFMQACRDELTVTDATLRDTECWITETEDAKLCGCACLKVYSQSHSGEIHLFFIDPDWQRQGIGKMLWQTILQRATEHQLTTLLLSADPSALAFYESMGFSVIGQSPSGSIAGRFLPQMSYSLID